MNRSRHQRGQLLVVVGALLGVLVGVTLGLAVDDGGAGMATVVPGTDRGAVLAAGAPGSRPPTSRTVGGGGGTQNAGPADRPGKDRDKRAKAKPEGHGKDKPGKDKGKAEKPERY